MDELIFAGNKYISSKRAGKLTGYTADYIGQMCRADKIQCRLVGRNWYVNEKEIWEHKKSFKKKQAVDYNKQETIEYEKIEPELLYYSNDKRSLNPEISKIPNERKEEIIENEEEEIPVRIIKKPAVYAKGYNKSYIAERTKKQIKIRQPIIPQIYTGFSIATSIALVLILIGVLFTASTFTLEQAIHYSSKDSSDIDTTFQLANVKETFGVFVSIKRLFEL